MLKVVIVGAGFAGLSCARALANQSKIELTVIDKRNYHLFQPLLYQVAMAGISPAEIAFPIRSILSKQKNTKVVLGKVSSLDLEKRKIFCSERGFEFDRLVLACGAQTSYFGKDSWKSLAPGLKSLEDATEIRRRVLLQFELAELEQDPLKRRGYLTFVIVGGGPTGVELAGSIGELSRFTLSKDFKNIDSKQTRVILIEAGSRILSSFNRGLSAHGVRQLEELGVQVWTDSRVTKISDEGLEVNGREHIDSKTVLWAAGVSPSELNLLLTNEKDSQGRMKVGNDLSLPGIPEVFVIGDQASVLDSKGTTLPGIAPVAMQEGRHVAKMILADLEGASRSPFKYSDKGQMATIGRSRAIAQVSTKIGFKGLLAWLMWLFVHIYYLIGVKNRLFVFFQWTWYYFTYRKGARLIVGNQNSEKE